MIGQLLPILIQSEPVKLPKVESVLQIHIILAYDCIEQHFDL